MIVHSDSGKWWRVVNFQVFGEGIVFVLSCGWLLMGEKFVESRESTLSVVLSQLLSTSLHRACISLCILNLFSFPFLPRGRSGILGTQNPSSQAWLVCPPDPQQTHCHQNGFCAPRNLLRCVLDEELPVISVLSCSDWEGVLFDNIIWLTLAFLHYHSI